MFFKRNKIIFLRSFLISKIKSIMIYYSCMMSKFDDWIIYGIKNENTFVYEIVNFNF